MSGKVLKAIIAPLAPKPVGCYSVAVQADNTLHLSGGIGIDPNTNKIVPGGVVPETKQIFKNMQAVLEAANSSFDKIAHVRIYLKNINDAAEVNQIYSQHISQPYPSRVMVEVSNLPLGANIEIEATALITSGSRI